MTYRLELLKAMAILSEDPRTLFVGQAVACPGTAMSDTFDCVPRDRLIEFPVAEDFQMGACTGLALAGFVPVCVFPRWNFLVLAANQIVNHLDKLPIYSNGLYVPKVIIRVAVPSIAPLYPQAQHVADFYEEFQRMCATITFIRIKDPSQIVPAYKLALSGPGSYLIAERVDDYEVKA